MSKPATSTPATPPLPTRRQLDELEALLQRMLELPVQPPEEEGTPLSNSSEIEEALLGEFSEIHSPWQETANEIGPEAAPDSAFLEQETALDPEWKAVEDSPLLESQPGLNAAWGHREYAESVEAIHVVPDSAGGVTDKGTIGEPRTDVWSLERAAPEPGIFRVMLGWCGLLCLIVSLAILLMDWFGWTW